MTELNISEPARRQTGVTKRKKTSLKIDMTPMVDLGFLLISFFIFTTAITSPKSMNLIMPTDGPPSPVKNSTVMTILIEKGNKLWYYFGDGKDAFRSNTLYSASYAEEKGIGEIIRQKKRSLLSKKDDLTIIIKPGRNASYQQLINVLDEMLINDVKKYVLADVDKQENEFLNRLK